MIKNAPFSIQATTEQTTFEINKSITCTSTINEMQVAKLNHHLRYFVYFLSLSPTVASIPNTMNQPIVTVNPLHTIISSKPNPITRRDIHTQ